MFFETCIDCGQDFPQYAAWQSRCVRCFRLHKEKCKSRHRVEVEWGNPFGGGTTIGILPDSGRQADRYGVWLRANIKELLHLCHPDKHGGSEQSTKITRELIKIFKEK